MQRKGMTRRGLAAFAVTAGVLCATLGTGRAASAATVDPFAGLTGTRQLTSDALDGLNNATVTSPYDPAQTISIGVMLSRPDPAGENAYLADVYNPKSPNFRNFVTSAEWQTRFGVSQARYQALLGWLHGGGLKTAAIAGSTEYVLAEG